MKSKKSAQLLLLFLVSCLTGLMLLFGIPAIRRTMYPVRYEATVFPLCERYELDPIFVYAVIKTESNFDERAQSSAGAKGLMQITEPTATYIANARKIDRYDLFSVEDNLDFGCWYFRYLFGRFSNRQTALAAYNAGEGTVREWLKDASVSPDGATLGEIPYKETANYIKKIAQNYSKYKKYYPQLFENK